MSPGAGGAAERMRSRLAEMRLAGWAMETALPGIQGFELEAMLAERDGLKVEVERLRAVIQWTHTAYCTSAWTDRDLHAPECLLYEIEP